MIHEERKNRAVETEKERDSSDRPATAIAGRADALFDAKRARPNQHARFGEREADSDARLERVLDFQNNFNDGSWALAKTACAQSHLAQCLCKRVNSL